MQIKLSNFILEQSISDASTDDIIFEQLNAQMDVAFAMLESCIKDYKMQTYQEVFTPSAPPPETPQPAEIRPAPGGDNQRLDSVEYPDTVKDDYGNPAIFYDTFTADNCVTYGMYRFENSSLQKNQYLQPQILVYDPNSELV